MEDKQKQNDIETKQDSSIEEMTLDESTFIETIAKFFNLTTFNFIFILSFFILGAYYLTASNQLISRGFSINGLKTKLEEIEKQNRELELEVMTLESYTQIDKRIAELKMVKVSEVEYIEAKEESVAMR